MSSQITNQYPGTVGRMFARQNVPSVYGAQKAASGMEVEEGREVWDSVSLSPFAPKPLTADFLEQALAAGRSLNEGGAVSPGTEERLREDRVFAAVSALALIGYREDEGSVAGWPGGVPAPTRDELEAARRRLAQRPSDAGGAADVDAVMGDRQELMRRIGKSDFAGLAFAAENAVAVAG